jgi:hypothetical protein
MKTTSDSIQFDDITVTLSDARPRRVNKRYWALIAQASETHDHNQQELDRGYRIDVRAHVIELPDDAGEQLAYYSGENPVRNLTFHPDQRVLVEARYSTSWQGERGRTAGYACTVADVVDTIRRAGEEVGAAEQLILDAIADLPPVAEQDETNVRPPASEAVLPPLSRDEALPVIQRMRAQGAASSNPSAKPCCTPTRTTCTPSSRPFRFTGPTTPGAWPKIQPLTTSDCEQSHQDTETHRAAAPHRTVPAPNRHPVPRYGSGITGHPRTLGGRA